MEAGAEQPRSGASTPRGSPPVAELGGVGGAIDMQVEAGGAGIGNNDLAAPAPGTSRQQLPATHVERIVFRLNVDTDGRVERFAGTKFAGGALADQIRHPRECALDREALAGRVEIADHHRRVTPWAAARVEAI